MAKAEQEDDDMGLTAKPDTAATTNSPLSPPAASLPHSHTHHHHHLGAILFKGDQFILVAQLCVAPAGSRCEADGGTRSARRRRERRLRSWLRHEQQSIAAVLATVTHHSGKVGTACGVLRDQKTATRTGHGEEYETHFTAKIRKTPPQGSQPAPLPEVAGWQGRLAFSDLFAETPAGDIRG